MKRLSIFLLSFISWISSGTVAYAQDMSEQAKNTDSYLSNPVFLILLGSILLLLIVILALSNAVSESAKLYNDKQKGGKKLSAILVLFLAGSIAANAQTAETIPAAPHDPNWYGIDPITFWTLISVIIFEILVALFLRNMLYHFLGVFERRDAQALKEPSILEKFNASVPVEKEEEIMFDHSYDGIRELDNNLPPWWKYGFYLTIVFAVFYISYYTMFGTGVSQLDEYKRELVQADLQMQEYRKKAANLVDETTVKMLSDNESLARGRDLFVNNCAACHLETGGGKVGPNLTDDYWLHGGNIKDVFKTIKYGYQEKGMKSWKDDFSAAQIACLASFVKSLHGSNPPEAKEHQGELYEEKMESSDSTKIKTDSIKVIKQDSSSVKMGK